jgi:hypothetical protein
MCLPNLTLSFLTICEIVTFKVEEKVFFAPAKGGQQSFGVQENHFFKYIENEPLQILVPRWVRYMSTKSHAQTRCWTLRKSSISTRGYAEIHIQRPFFDNKNSIWKILRLKIQTVETCSSACSIHRNLYLFFEKY